jgi:hypothetical protein
MDSKKFFAVFSCALIICACLLSGCQKNKILVKVKKDGSGTIVVTQLFNAKLVKIVEEEKKKNDQFAVKLINEEQIKRAASLFGPNVKFDKMKELNRPDGSKGYIALYTFDNISDLRIPIGGVMSSAIGKKVEFDFKTDPQKGSPLTVMLDKLEKPKPEENGKKEYPHHPQSEQELMNIKRAIAMGANPFGLSEKDSKEKTMKKVFADMSSSLEIETSGTVVKSNAAYRSKEKPSRFTIFEADLNKLMKSDKFLYDLAEADNQTRGRLMEFMYACPEGFKYDNQGKITVEFK